MSWTGSCGAGSGGRTDDGCRVCVAFAERLCYLEDVKTEPHLRSALAPIVDRRVSIGVAHAADPPGIREARGAWFRH